MANRTAVVGSSYSGSDVSGPFHAATTSDAVVDGNGVLLSGIAGARVLMSPLTKGVGGFTLISDKAYFVYLGRTLEALTLTHVEFHVSTGGTGAQTAEVGFFSTPLAPNKSTQTVTKLVSTGTVDDLTGTGVMRNTNNFATAITAGTYLWAGIRTAMASTQPVLAGLSVDMAQGFVLSTATAGALTAAGPWTGAIITASLVDICPDLRGTLD